MGEPRPFRGSRSRTACDVAEDADSEADLALGAIVVSLAVAAIGEAAARLLTATAWSPARTARLSLTILQEAECSAA